MKICYCDWLNKQADWPITEEDKVSWDSQTKNDEMKKGGFRELASQMETDSDIQNGIEVKTMSLRAVHGLIEIG